MATTLRIQDKGLKAMLERVNKAALKRELTVGVHDDAGAAGHGGKTVIDIATANEFGLGVPQRSFIGAWADERKAEHEEHLRKLGEAIIKGRVKDVKLGLAQLGEAYVGEVQGRIAQGVPPPNAPSTIARKGSSTPLIDKGVLRSSIAAKVDGQGAGAIVAAVAKKSGGKKKGKKLKLRAKLAKQLRRLKKALKKGLKKLKLSAKTKAEARRQLKQAKRALVKRTKAVLRSARRSAKDLKRSGTRAKKGLVRAAKRSYKSTARSATRTYNRAAKAVKRTFRGSRRRRRR